MPTLKLKTLFCQVPEDSGTDEAYLIMDELKLWGQKSMSAGQGRAVNYQKTFANSIKIKPFDQDGLFDNDDYLGTVTVTKALKGKGEQIGKFTGDGANYSLHYEVV